MRKRSFQSLILLALCVTVTSCFRISLILQPHEAKTNSVFSGKVVVKTDGGQSEQRNVYGLFGICVPTGWETEGDIVMTQVPMSTTTLSGDYKNTITRRMKASKPYTDLLNRDYPKAGYTWLGYVTVRSFETIVDSARVEMDSVYVEYKIKTNDKTGTFYLDYMTGHIKQSELSTIGKKQNGDVTSAASFQDDNIGNATFTDTRITVSRPNQTTEEAATIYPETQQKWNLLLMDESTRPGGPRAYKDKKYNLLFTRTRGWNGGDGVFTVALPNGDVFWTFNDSFYGSVNSTNRARGSSSFPRNSIMVQKFVNGTLGETSRNFTWLADYVNWTNSSQDRYFHCRTHLRHPDGELSDAQIAAGDIDQTMVYWSGDGTIVDGKLQVLWFGTQSQELRATGTTIATYSLEGNIPKDYYLKNLADYLPHKGDYLYLEKVTHQINDNEVSYGSTLWEDEDGHLYLYACDGYHPIVARTEHHDLYSKWTYYVKDTNGNFKWQEKYPTKEEMGRSTIMSTTDYAGSLPWVFKEGDWYYMTMQAPYFSRQVYIYRAKTPYGPFDERRPLFLLPDHIDKKGSQKYRWLYMVNLHQPLSREGELVFTTNTDPDEFWMNFNDEGSADYYRPYFYRVFNWKSVYADEDEPTGIKSVHNSESIVHSDTAVYDLQGRKVADNSQLSTINSQLKPGIYIVNGKKIVIK